MTEDKKTGKDLLFNPERVVMFLMMMTFCIGMVEAHAHNGKESINSPKHYSLILKKNLPHVMPVIISNMDKLIITPEQKKEFDKIMNEVPSIFLEKTGEAMKIEQSISSQILKEAKTKEDLKESLNKLQRLKRETIEVV